jgi:hypothetical protein
MAITELWTGKVLFDTVSHEAGVLKPLPCKTEFSKDGIGR